MTANTTVEQTRDLEVRFMRLGCGDDVITWCMPLYQETDAVEGWFIRDTVVVLVDLDPELQKQTCMMMPWLPRGIVDNSDAILEKDEVILVKKVDPEVERYYKQLCREVFSHKPKIFNAKKKVEGKNVFGFDMSKIRPVKSIQNEKEEQKANT